MIQYVHCIVIGVCRMFWSFVYIFRSVYEAVSSCVYPNIVSGIYVYCYMYVHCLASNKCFESRSRIYRYVTLVCLFVSYIFNRRLFVNDLDTIVDGGCAGD